MRTLLIGAAAASLFAWSVAANAQSAPGLVGGAAVGAGIGAIGGPVGAVVGAVAGGITAYELTEHAPNGKQWEQIINQSTEVAQEIDW